MMMGQLMDGDRLSERILATVQEQVASLRAAPALGVIKVEGDPASEAFVNIKQQRCSEVGIDCRVFSFAQDTPQREFFECIEKLNADRAITGILVQLPLPPSYDTRRILDSISPDKDVEAVTTQRLGSLFCGIEEVIPCTPKGVLSLAEHYGVTFEGRHVCLVGYSDIIGKPLSALCLNRNATLTVCHRYTKDLAAHTSQADIVISAAGTPGLIGARMIKEGSVLVDVGFCRQEGIVRGDVDTASVEEKCSLLSPVPGGVGPMTVASLLENVVLFADR